MLYATAYTDLNLYPGLISYFYLNSVPIDVTLMLGTVSQFFFFFLIIG